MRRAALTFASSFIFEPQVSPALADGLGARALAVQIAVDHEDGIDVEGLAETGHDHVDEGGRLFNQIRSRQTAVNPPSTVMPAPVMKLASSLARKAANRETSRG